MKMFLLSAQNNFYVILSSYVEGQVKENQLWVSCLWLVSSSPKSRWFFREFFVELVRKSFSGRNNSREPPVFRFSDSLPYVLEESRELRALSRWVLEEWAFKNTIHFSANNFVLCLFELPLCLWIHKLLWNTKFYFF